MVNANYIRYKANKTGAYKTKHVVKSQHKQYINDIQCNKPFCVF